MSKGSKAVLALLLGCVSGVGATAQTTGGAVVGAVPIPGVSQIGLAALARDAREHLRALIRLDTSNPPGRERLAADYLKSQLDREGIEAQLYPSTGTRATLYARLRGSGAKRPLMLACHTDVVPADRGEWTVDPFGGETENGYIYGRGAADNKSMCAAELAILIQLKRVGAPLQRDVVFFAAADEESGEGERHIDRLIREHPELFAAQFAINEGGITLWENGRVVEMQIQAAEKDFLDLTLIARGQSSHPAVPSADNAVAALLRASGRLCEARFPAEINPVARLFLERQAESAAPLLARAISDVLAAAPGEPLDRAADRLANLNPEFSVLLRDTLTPTMLEAGYKSNVVPGRARAVFNARLMPGRDPALFLSRLRGMIQDPGVEISAAAASSAVVAAMPLEDELYRAVESSAVRFAPGARVVPFMAPWSTDSRQLRLQGIVTYGVAVPMSAQDGQRVHGKDERLALAALDWYAAYLFEVVLTVAGAPAAGKAAMQ